VEVASNVEEAVAFLDTPGQRIDVAVLDVNLGGENSVAIAERLAAQGRPFIFATGYHDRAMIPPAHAGVPVIRKPFTAEGMARAIQEAVAGIRPSPH
jgi:FixJ family two-component response regulator